ncbi:hypothetical protein DIPPA_64463, partial [Diplonema papillatum]
MTARTILGLSLLATPLLAAYTSITAELEHFSLRPNFAPFVVKDVATASGGKAIELPDGVSLSLNPNSMDDRQVVIPFTTTQVAAVNVYVHGLFPDYTRDSFFYGIDPETSSYYTQNGAIAADWDIYGRTFPFLAAGEHTLVLKARETEAVMDRIVIVVLEGEIFYAGPVLVIELESLSSQSSFSPFVIESHVD